MKWLDHRTMSGPIKPSTRLNASSLKRNSSSRSSRKCGVSSSSDSLDPFSARWFVREDNKLPAYRSRASLIHCVGVMLNYFLNVRLRCSGLFGDSS